VALAGHCHACELVGGLFANALEDYGAARSLVALWLPSSVRGETRLVVDTSACGSRTFALNLARDLIVPLERRSALGGPVVSGSAAVGSPDAAADIHVHLRRLSSGAVVPPPDAASNPVLCRRAPGPVHGCIRIVEDVVRMYFSMPFHGVLI
jgi:hypothetical protein